MQFIIPFCDLRPVRDKNYQTIHTLTELSLENATCDFQSTHQQMKEVMTIQLTYAFLFLIIQRSVKKFATMILNTV